MSHFLPWMKCDSVWGRRVFHVRTRSPCRAIVTTRRTLAMILLSMVLAVVWVTNAVYLASDWPGPRQVCADIDRWMKHTFSKTESYCIALDQRRRKVSANAAVVSRLVAGAGSSRIDREPINHQAWKLADPVRILPSGEVGQVRILFQTQEQGRFLQCKADSKPRPGL